MGNQLEAKFFRRLSNEKNYFKISQKKVMKGGIKMTEVINTKGLPEEYIKLVQEFADFLRQKIFRTEKGKEKISFHGWPFQKIIT